MNDSGLEAEVVEDLESVRADWQRLALASRNVFATWEWTTLWWSHFGQDRRRFVVTCRAADGTLVAIVPLYLWRERPVRILRFLGHGPGADGPMEALSEAIKPKESWSASAILSGCCIVPICTMR